MQGLSAIFYLVMRKTPLEEEAESFVLGIGHAGADECPEVAEIGGFIDHVEGGTDIPVGKLQGLQSGADLEPSPGLVFHLVMHVGLTKTGIVQITAGIQIFLDETG